MHQALASHYAGHRHIELLSPDQAQAQQTLDPEALNGSNQLRLAVLGQNAPDQVLLAAVFDNLGKGASGAAVQNLDLMLGLGAV